MQKTLIRPNVESELDDVRNKTVNKNKQIETDQM